MRKFTTNFMKLSVRMAVLLLIASMAVAQQDSGNLNGEKPEVVEIEKLKKQIKVLQQRLEQQNGSSEKDSLDLSGEEFPSIDKVTSRHVMARPWYQNIDISGFGSAGFLDTGVDGARPEGGFLIKEASLFMEADVWENTSIYVEIQTNRLGDDKSKFIRTGEVYAHFRNVLRNWGDDLLGIKAGRIDMPFGEEYLWQDASDNPLISFSVAYPYGWDEGVLLYGKAHGVGWIAAMTDGSDARSVEDHASKAFNAKLYGNLFEPLYVSASFMKNGKAGKSAIEFGGSHFQPVGASHASSAGTSPNNLVDAILYQVDAKYGFGKFGMKGHIALFYGKAFQDDSDPLFDRDFRWFSIEPLYNMARNVYAVMRYSEIGTYDSEKGYHFDGKTTAGGNSAFGYDTKRFRRLSLGLGWKPNPRVKLKVEVGRDWFEVIESHPLSPNNNGRNLFGIELALNF